MGINTRSALVGVAAAVAGCANEPEFKVVEQKKAESAVVDRHIRDTASGVTVVIPGESGKDIIYYERQKNKKGDEKCYAGIADEVTYDQDITGSTRVQDDCPKDALLCFVHYGEQKLIFSGKNNNKALVDCSVFDKKSPPKKPEKSNGAPYIPVIQLSN